MNCAQLCTASLTVPSAVECSWEGVQVCSWEPTKAPEFAEDRMSEHGLQRSVPACTEPLVISTQTLQCIQRRDSLGRTLAPLKLSNSCQCTGMNYSVLRELVSSLKNPDVECIAMFGLKWQEAQCMQARISADRAPTSCLRRTPAPSLALMSTLEHLPNYTPLHWAQ